MNWVSAAVDFRAPARIRRRNSSGLSYRQQKVDAVTKEPVIGALVRVISNSLRAASATSWEVSLSQLPAATVALTVTHLAITIFT